VIIVFPSNKWVALTRAGWVYGHFRPNCLIDNGRDPDTSDPRHFGTGAEVFIGHFGTTAKIRDTSASVPKCPRNTSANTFVFLYWRIAYH